jgi:ABC-type branched-subunit amino acid transport system permease subunit
LNASESAPTVELPIVGDARPSRRYWSWLDDEQNRRSANWVAGVLAFYWLLQRLWHPPAGVILLGAVVGGLYAMIALGVALVYRANRFVNFAQGDIGGAPAALTVLLISALHWPYPVGILVGLTSGVLLGVVIEFTVIRRFANAPRLVLTVVSIGLSALLTIVEVGLPNFFGLTFTPESFPSPFNFHFAVGPIRFHGNDILAMVMVPVALASLAWFLNKTHVGVAIRACAESRDRASLLGVPVKRVNLVVWAVSSLLATVALILWAGVVGLPIGSPLGLDVLLIVLGAAALGRFENMPVIAGASILIGIVEQSAVWDTGSSDTVYLVVFLVIMAALLFQPSRLVSRAEDAALSTWTAIREVRPVPPELDRLPEVRWTKRSLIVLLAGFAVATPFIFGVAKTQLAAFLCAYLIIALSLLVLSGWAGQISLGQFAFVGLGSTVAAWTALHWHLDIALQLLVSGSLGAITAVIVGIPALRIRGLFLAVATLGFGFAANFYFLSSSHFSWIPNQFTAVPRLPMFGRLWLSSADRLYYLSLAVLFLCILSVLGLRHSRTGRVLIAVRENERGAQAYGISATRAKLVAFAVSGFLAAVAGVLILTQQGYLYSGSADPESSVIVFEMAVIGGLGSMTGVFAGAVYVEAFSWFRSSVPHALQGVFQLLGSGVGLIIILMFLPAGLSSAIYQGRDRLLREVARRRGIVVPSLVADQLEGAPPVPDEGFEPTVEPAAGTHSSPQEFVHAQRTAVTR